MKMPHWVRTPAHRLFISWSHWSPAVRDLGGHRVALAALVRLPQQYHARWLHVFSERTPSRLSNSCIDCGNSPMQGCGDWPQQSQHLLMLQSKQPYVLQQQFRHHLQQQLLWSLHHCRASAWTTSHDRRFVSSTGSSGDSSSSRGSSSGTNTRSGTDSSAGTTRGDKDTNKPSSRSSSRFRMPSASSLKNSPQWIGMRRQQQRLQRLWLRELQRHQQQDSLFNRVKVALAAAQLQVLGLLQRALGPARQQQLQNQLKQRRQSLQERGTKLRQSQQLVLVRLRQRLRLQQQQLRRQLQQQHSAMQERRLIWAERRRRKLAAALLLLQQQRVHLTAATAGVRRDSSPVSTRSTKYTSENL